MKKILLILLSVIMVFSLIACKENKTPDPSDPTLSITDFFDVPYQYKLNSYIDISKEDYVGIELERVVVDVTDDEINAAIYEDLKDNGTLVDVDRGAKMGDTININFTGSVDGVEFDGGAAENYEMVLGQAGFIDGFEDALIDHKTGEEFVIDVTFPEDYGNESLNGKAAKFAIKMNSVKELILPELTNDFLKETFDCNSIEEYMALVNETLIIEKTEEAKNAQKSTAFEKVYKNVEIKDYPKEEYEKYYNDFVSYYEDFAKDYLGITLTEYIVDYCNSTEDEFYYYADMSAAMNVEQELVCYAIANTEGLWKGLTKGDYDAYAEIVAEDNGFETVEDFEAEYGSDMIWNGLILEKTIEFVIDNATIVDPAPAESTEVTE